MSKSRDIAVIGLSGMFPGAYNIEQFFSQVVYGTDAIQNIPSSHWDPKAYYDKDQKAKDRTYGKTGGFLKEYPFEPLAFGISPHTLEATDTSQLLGMVVAHAALVDAGYGPERSFDHERTSCILGVTGALELVVPLGARLGHPLWAKALKRAGVDDAIADEVMKEIGDQYVGWQEASFPGLLGNVVSGRIASRFHLRGTNKVVDAACGSSLAALMSAVMELESGRSDMVITGGVDTFNDIFMYMCFSKTPALSPTGHARPFDDKGDGTTLGEGLGMVVLKRLDDALAASDHIYAVIKGVGSSSDGRGKAIYAPSAEGQAIALRRAYEQAGIDPKTIGYIEAHGTGTRVGDGEELLGLKTVLTHEEPPCALGSVKAQIGHTKAAAGAAGLIKAILSLYYQVLPPTTKVTTPHRYLVDSPFVLPKMPRPWLAETRRAGVSAFGFGGSNYHCVLESFHEPRGLQKEAFTLLLPLSGHSLRELQAALQASGELRHWLHLQRFAKDWQARFQASAPYRLVMICEEKDFPLHAERMKAIAKALPSPSLPDGVFFGEGQPKPLSVVFTGQGSQKVGMGQHLLGHHGLLQQHLRVASSLSDLDLLDALFPLTGPSKEAHALLRQTQYAQPALAIYGAVMSQILEALGVKVRAFLGHSLGELTALFAAKSLELKDFLSLAMERGQAMAKAPKGAMAAVSASEQELRGYLSAKKVWVANVNSPTQTVLSGDEAALDGVLATLAAKGIFGKKLSVSGAFHSELMAQASEDFAKALGGKVFQTPKASVVSNETARFYPSDPEEIRAQFKRHMLSPVRFQDSLSFLVSEGVEAFLEIGPKAQLSPLIKQSLGDQIEVMALTDESTSLPRVVAQLASLGQEIDFSLWGAEALPKPLPKPSQWVAVSGANRKPPPLSDKPMVQSHPRKDIVEEKKPKVRPQPAGQSGFIEESLFALQKLQMQNAKLHEQYLKGQQQSQELFQTLLAQWGAVPKGAPPPSRGFFYEEENRNERPPEPPVPFVPPPPLERPAPPPVRTVARPAAREPIRQEMPQAELKEPHEDLLSLIQGVVSEKTGYPKESIGIDMSFEGDLGIDSIKRVEILAHLKEAWPKGPWPEDGAQFAEFDSIRSLMSALASSPQKRQGAVKAPQPSKVLQVIGDKTGYPLESLNAKLDLEADLGLDSIKKVEILAGLQEAYGQTQDVSSAFQNAHTVGDLEALFEPPSSDSAPLDTRPKADVMEVLRAIVSEKTGYPLEALEPSMQLEGDLGIDSIKRVEILSALKEKLPDIKGSEDWGQAQTMEDVVTMVKREAPSWPSSQAEPTSIQHWVLKPEALTFPPKAKAFHWQKGDVVWIASDGNGLAPALKHIYEAEGVRVRVLTMRGLKRIKAPATLRALLILAPHGLSLEQERQHLIQVLFLLKRLRPALQAGADERPARVVAITALGGQFGLGGLDQKAQALSYGLAGFIKTCAQEWPEVKAQILDYSRSFLTAEMAAVRIAETLDYVDALEIGLTPEGVFGLRLEERRLNPIPKALPLAEGEGLLVTGGAQGVTRWVLKQFALLCRPKILILGRTPLPNEKPLPLSEAQWVSRLIEEGLPLPKARQAAKAKRKASEVYTAVEDLRSLGLTVMYEACDGRDPKAVRAALKAMGSTPIRAVIHGAGILADKAIVDKEPEDFLAVYDTKVKGLLNIMSALDQEQLRMLLLFSSSTARFGRKGQLDYAVANETLNKLAHYYKAKWEKCQVRSLGFGPFDGGMVHEGLKKLFTAEGVGLIPLAEAGEACLAHFGPGPSEGSEWVVMAKPPSPPPVVKKNSMAVPLQIEVSVAQWPALQDHVINGQAVVPVAMVLEWLDQLGRMLEPKAKQVEILHFKVLKGVTLAAEEAVSLSFATKSLPASHGKLSYDVVVEDSAQKRKFYEARISLSLKDEAHLWGAPKLPLEVDLYEDRGAEIYRQLFHGPKWQGIHQLKGLSKLGFSAMIQAPDSAPMQEVAGARALVVDCAFQLMVFWAHEQWGEPSLPMAIEQWSMSEAPWASGLYEIRGQILKDAPPRVRAHLEIVGPDQRVMAQGMGFEGVSTGELGQLFQRNQLSPSALPLGLTSTGH